MNQIVVLIFPDQAKIDEAIRTLRKLHSERSIKLYASAVVAKNRNAIRSNSELEHSVKPGGTHVSQSIPLRWATRLSRKSSLCAGKNGE
jgi:uncharacterized membrane protein